MINTLHRGFPPVSKDDVVIPGLVVYSYWLKVARNHAILGDRARVGLEQLFGELGREYQEQIIAGHMYTVGLF
ncbi:MAG: hypothetical protein IT324_25525 [Anaerolineae bacterium]|nr:hypothetical protein [Anaerolineae bacterium]